MTDAVPYPKGQEKPGQKQNVEPTRPPKPPNEKQVSRILIVGLLSCAAFFVVFMLTAIRMWMQPPTEIPEWKPQDSIAVEDRGTETRAQRSIRFTPPLTQQTKLVPDDLPSNQGPATTAARQPRISDSNPMTPGHEGNTNQSGNNVIWGADDGVRSLTLERSAGSQASVVLSRSRPDLLLFGQSVVKVDTGQPIGVLPPEFRRGRSVINQQGTRAARYANANGEAVAVILSYSVSDPEAPPVRIENNNGTWKIDWFSFLDETRLMFHSEEDGFLIWDSVTGKQLTTLKTERPNGSGVTVTQNGKYLAVASHRDVIVYDTLRGQEAAQMAGSHEGKDIEFFWCHGLEFSADGTELAGIFTDGQFVVWSHKGDVVLQQTLDDVGRGVSSGRTQLQWMPDGKAWLINDKMLLDRASMEIVWRIRGETGWCKVIDQNSILIRSENDSNRLLILPLPWNEINEALAVADFSRPPLLAPGGSVTLDCRVAATRFSDSNATKTAILEAVSNQLAKRRITVGDNPDVILTIDYLEEAGKSIQVSDSPGLLGGSTRQMTVEDSSLTLTAEIRVTGKAEPVWKDAINVSTGMLVETNDLTPKGFRDQNFKRLLQRLEKVSLPSRIMPPNNNGLPIETRLESGKIYANTTVIPDLVSEVQGDPLIDEASATKNSKTTANAETPVTSLADSAESSNGNSDSPEAGAGDTEPIVIPEFSEVAANWKSVPQSARIPVPLEIADSSMPAFSSIRPDFVLYRRSLFDVNSGNKIADLPPEFAESEALISPGGEFLARIEKHSVHRVSAIHIHPRNQPQKSVPLAIDHYEHVHWVQFLNNSMLIAFGRQPNGGLWTLWDARTGNVIRKTVGPGPELSEPVSCVSPSGSLVAASCDDDRIRIYDFEKGGVIGVLQMKRTLGRHVVPVKCQAIQFSPDSKEVAAAAYPGRLAVWNLEGSVVDEITIYYEEFPPEIKRLCWLPDASGWLLGDTTILDRETKTVVWKGKYRPGELSQDPMGCALAQDQLLLTLGDDEGRELVPFTIPWDEINALREELKKSEHISLHSGEKISLDLSTGETRFPLSAEMTNTLHDTLTSTLTTAGLSIAEQQPLRLIATYSEKVAEKRNTGLLGALLLPPESDSESDVTSTEVMLLLEIRKPNSDEVLWSKEIRTTGGLFGRGDTNSEESRRDNAFDNLMLRISVIKPPTRIYLNKPKGLPVISPL